ncbi:MAG: hypothetical protein ACP6IY_20715 [Promethearchaeia archaeon]
MESQDINIGYNVPKYYQSFLKKLIENFYDYKLAIFILLLTSIGLFIVLIFFTDIIVIVFIHVIIFILIFCFISVIHDYKKAIYFITSPDSENKLLEKKKFWAYVDSLPYMNFSIYIRINLIKQPSLRKFYLLIYQKRTSLAKFIFFIIFSLFLACLSWFFSIYFQTFLITLLFSYFTVSVLILAFYFFWQYYRTKITLNSIDISKI